MKKIKFVAAMTLAALCLAGAAFAEDATAIMEKSTNLTPPSFSKTVLIMELIDKSGKVTEHREIMQYGNRKDDVIKTVFDFKSPASVKDTRIHQSEKKGKSDDKYIYLPSLKTVRRIAAAERQKSFVGSDFTYNDMTVRKASDDAHEMVSESATAKTNGGTVNCWKIKSTPVANKNVEFAYRIIFVDKDTYLPILVEYYDKKGTLIKTQSIEKFDIVTGATGIKYPLRRMVRNTNVLTGHQTTVVIDKIEFDKEIPDRYFQQNWLSTGK